MERAAFLIERSGQRVSCLLNPDHFVQRRTAGLTSHRRLGAVGRVDDPVLATGGGRTELEIDLFFDIGLSGSTPAADDVRDLTRPLWDLADGRLAVDGPPLVRFVWGKAWNVPAVVEAASERLEQFGLGGVPERSWLRLRLVRVADPPLAPAVDPAAPPIAPTVEPGREVVSAGERLDTLMGRLGVHPGRWKEVALFNKIEDPARVPPGTVVRVPPVAAA